MIPKLFHFTHGDNHWYYTNARKDITHEGIKYIHIRGLDCSAIEDESIDKADIDVTFPQPYALLNEDGKSLSQIFVNKIFYQGVRLEIFELEEDTKLFVFRGRVVLPKFDEDADTMTLNCSTAESQFRRTIFTRKFQRTCPNSIYDLFCGLDIDEWAFEVRITSVNGTVFEWAALDEELIIPDDYLDNGLLIKDGIYTWLRGANTMYRPHYGLAVNDIVKLAPGCDQTRKVCIEKFDNGKRFGGHISIPNENPYDTFILK
ncbi:phage BR0599 family protein [Acinetobacter thermotolerans]|uniref:phage BR0599 family protein n=1 Tax=Acinetobacter thermotolerans TaxID=3151487 RepID=UPI00325C04DF